MTMSNPVVEISSPTYFGVNSNGSIDAIPEPETWSGFTQSGIERKEDAIRTLEFQTSYFLYIVDTNIYFAEKINHFIKSDIPNPEIWDDACEIHSVSGITFTPWTVYNRLFTISPGFWYQCSESHFGIYPDWIPVSDNRYDRESFVNTLVKAIDDSTQGHQELIYTLSGGLDSALVMHLAVQKLKKGGITLTAAMDGFDEELPKAKRFSNAVNLENFVYKAEDKKIYQPVISDYTLETLLPASDPVLPIVFEMIRSLNNKSPSCILEGQGADSVCFGLPHNVILDRYSKQKRWIYYVLNPVIPIVRNKTNPLSRLLYKVKKAASILSQPTLVDAYLAAFNILPEMINNSFYVSVRNYMDHCFESYPSRHYAICHFYLYSVLPAREMQKYVLPEKLGFQVCLPFLDRKVIDYVFSVPVKTFFFNGSPKTELFALGDLFFPGEFSQKKTTPFYVSYPLQPVNESVNMEGVKKYTILDKETSAFGRMTINQLLAIVVQNGQDNPA